MSNPAARKSRKRSLKSEDLQHNEKKPLLRNDTSDVRTIPIDSPAESPYFSINSDATALASQPTDGASGNADHNSMPKDRLTYEFYDQPCEDLAKKLLGKRLVRLLAGGERVSGVIVETESYLGGDDHASHSYKGKKTDRTEPMFMPPGTSYVYHIYGMYTCFNISSRGEGAAVLVRALDPIEGQDSMRLRRGLKRSDSGAKLKVKELTNGPSKLTQALDITKDPINKEDLVTSTTIWVEDGEDIPEEQIVKSARIGIKCDEKWEKAPLRFYALKRLGVSIKDKAAEKLMMESASSS